MTNKTALQLLPLIQPSQAQKHVTVNAAMTVLDVLVQTTAISRTLTAPPVGALAGDSYIVAAGATADWLGQDRAVAVFTGSFWDFYLPKTGWRVWLEGEETEAVFDGTLWTTSADRPERVAALGISATADDVNRLTVSAAATLLTNAGAGHQLKINKAHTGDTASLVFQNNYSGRAEMGNVGNDNFVLKVSPDGTTFLTGLTIEAATGRVIASHGVNILPGSADPASPQDGDIWYNSTLGKLRTRQGGVSLDLCDVTAAQITDSSAAGRALLLAADATAQRAALGVEAAANKGAANGYAGLDGSGKVPAGQLPSFVDDVLEFANLSALPGTGETGKIYVTLDSGKTWRWSGSAYVEISNTAPAFSDVTGRPTNLGGYGITDAVDLASAQTISGSKTFTGAVSFTGPHVIVDSGLTLQDDVDATKRASFQLSGLSTAVTRSYGLPDASGSVVIDATPVTTIGNVTSSPVTVNLAAGAAPAGQSKAINIGTAGLAGSTTNIVLGSGVSGALGALTIASPTVSFASSVTSVTMADSALTLQSSADATKQAKFDISALTPGTTRNLALPNASGTLALNTGFGALVPGLVPASGGGSTNFLRADGTWASPPGGGASSAYGLLTGVPPAIDALDALTPSADTLAYFTATATAALSTLTSYGRSLIDDADAATARTTLERQDFGTRAAFVTWAAGRTPPVGHVMRAGGYVYRYLGSGSAISDLPGWVPDSGVHLVHFGADSTGTVSCSTQFKNAIDYVASLGGGRIDTSGGTWRCDAQVNVDVGQDGIAIIGNGVIKKGVDSANNVIRVYANFFVCEGVTLDGQKAINTTDTSLLVVYGADAKISNARFTGSPKNGIGLGYHATSGLTTTRIKVTNCTFDSNDGVGLSNAGTAGFSFVGNTFKLNGLEGITLDQGTRLGVVTGNHFDRNNQGSLEGAFGIGQIGYDAAVQVSIIGNTFFGDGTKSAIRMGNATGSSAALAITGNTFDGHTVAIDMSGTTATIAGDNGSLISGNSGQNCTTLIAYDGRSTRLKIGPNAAGVGVTNYINSELAVAGTYLTEHPTFASLTAVPTTLAGHNITDAMPLAADLTYMPNSGFKQPARFATAANVVLATGGLVTVDGLTPAAGDRVLCLGQTAPAENGIYIASTGAWVRAADANDTNKLASAMVMVERGTTYGGTRWANNWKRGNVLGTAALSWFRVLDTGMAATVVADLTTAQTVGGAKTFSSPLGMTVQSADPAAAAAGTMALYTKKWAEKAIPVFRGESGASVPVQAAMWGARTTWAYPIVNTTALNTCGLKLTTSTITGVQPATTSMFTRMLRSNFTSLATAGKWGGLRSAEMTCTTGNGAGLGGFWISMRFGIADATLVSGAQMFAGLWLLNSDPTSAALEPSTLTRAICVGHGAADTNLKLFYGGTSAQTPIDLGVNFPTNTVGTDIYELTLHAPSNLTGTVYYRVERINTGNVATGTLSGAAAVLPDATTQLSVNMWRGNGATAAATTLAFMHLYAQTEQ